MISIPKYRRPQAQPCFVRVLVSFLLLLLLFPSPLAVAAVIEEAEISNDERLVAPGAPSSSSGQSCCDQSGVEPGATSLDGPISNLSSEHLVSLLELNILGKTFPAKDETERLSQVEAAVFGKEYDDFSHEVLTRVSRLFYAAPPPDELVAKLSAIASSQPNWFKKSMSVDWSNSLIQRVSLLELHTYNKISPKKDIFLRILALERDALGEGKAPDGNLDDRVNGLMSALRPTGDLIDDVENATKHDFGWLFNPASLGWFKPFSTSSKNLGKSFGSAGKDTASGLGRVLTSPTLWKTLIALGLIYGYVELARRGGLPVYGSSSPYAGERGCTADGACRVCSSCRYCYNCNNGGSLCGVWFRTH